MRLHHFARWVMPWRLPRRDEESRIHLEHHGETLETHQRRVKVACRVMATRDCMRTIARLSLLLTY